MVTAFISLEYAFDQAWSVAKRWKDEDARARSMVRDYGRGEEPAKGVVDELAEKWWEKEVPRQELLKHAASGAGAGAILGLAFSAWSAFSLPNLLRTQTDSPSCLRSLLRSGSAESRPGLHRRRCLSRLRLPSRSSSPARRAAARPRYLWPQAGTEPAPNPRAVR